MSNTDNKKAKITDENREEAARLMALWKAKPRISQAEFGAKYELGNQSNVGHYLNARSALNPKAALAFAAEIGCDVAEFSPRVKKEISDLGRPASFSASSFTTSAQTAAAESGNVSAAPEGHGPYPIICEVQAGDWTDIYDNFQPGDAEGWMISPHNLGPHGYMLRVKGKSMYAPGERYSFDEGMLLHVRPEVDPMPGQFVVVRREGQNSATFKRYMLIEGLPFLVAINPDWPKELKYLALQPGDVWCGVVVDASMGGLP